MRCETCKHWGEWPYAGSLDYQDDFDLGMRGCALLSQSREEPGRLTQGGGAVLTAPVFFCAEWASKG
jgi:hypothetical protein